MKETKDRDKLNIIFPEGRGLSEYTYVQEITDEVYSKEKLFISLLAMDFPSNKSLKSRKEIEAKWIKTLPELDNVKSISLRLRVNQDFFEAVCKMKNLETLTLWTSTIDDISSIANLKKLKRLDLDSCNRLEDITPLKALKTIEILSITNCFKIKNYEIIGQLTTLVGLAIQGDKFAPKTLRIASLKHFLSLQKLEHLNLNLTNVIDKSYDVLLTLKTLKRFDTISVIEKSLREKIKTHPNLTAGFFIDYDWDKKEFYPGKEW